jgi:DNA polymerase III alpha subunit
MDCERGTPSVSLDLLARHADGIFALTGSIGGWVPSLAARGDMRAATEAAATLIDIFERRIAIECWDHHLAQERETVAGVYERPQRGRAQEARSLGHGDRARRRDP